MIWKKLTCFFMLAFLFLGLCTCFYNKEEVLYPNQTNTCDTTNITFNGKVVAVLEANCFRCHGNAVAISEGAGIRLEDYADVNDRMDQMYGAMAHLDGYLPMPRDKSSKIDSCQIKTFRIWKDAGGLNN